MRGKRKYINLVQEKEHNQEHEEERQEGETRQGSPVDIRPSIENSATLLRVIASWLHEIVRRFKEFKGPQKEPRGYNVVFMVLPFKSLHFTAFQYPEGGLESDTAGAARLYFSFLL